METHSGKVITTANIKQIFKKEIKSESVMPLQIECATCTSSVLALSTENCNILFSRTTLSDTTCFSFYQQSIIN